MPCGIVGVPVAHEAMRKLGFGFARSSRQGAGHQLLADAHPKPAGDQLVEDKSFGPAKRRPCVKDKGFAGLFILGVNLAQCRDPRGKRLIILRRVGGQNQRDRLGQIADDAVAFLEQPQGDARALGGPFAQLGGGDGAFGAAAGKQGDGP